IIHFKPDEEIFAVLEYKYDTIATRLREMSFLNAGIRINLTDLRDVDESGNPRFDEFYSEGGLVEFVDYLDGTRQKIIETPILIDTEKNGIPVQVAMSYNRSYSEHVVSYVNTINTDEGGTQVCGFRRALARTLTRYAAKSRMLDELKLREPGE